jgi:muramoyltetrapeptide carboxypeptidase
MPSYKWQALSRGNRVEIIAPGMAFDPKELKKSIRVLKGWGLSVHSPANLLGTHPVSAHSEEMRWQHLEAALRSDSAVIWAARGGYGSLHLLKYLQKLKPPVRPKLLIGFSDITTLHQFVNDQWGWSSIHGPHIDRLHTLSSVRLEEMRKILFGEVSAVVFKKIKPLNSLAQKKKKITGALVGGNLITTQSTLGTSWQLNTKKRIVFLEDIGERGYRVDRVLEHMNLISFFKKTEAVIFGPFVGGTEPDGTSRVLKVLKLFAEKADFPVYLGIESGHIPNSKCLPLNTHCEIINSGMKIQISIDVGSKC